MTDPRAWPTFVFDLDGTLVDSVYHHVLAWREALERAGIELAVWRIHRRIGMSGGLFVNALLRETGGAVTAGKSRRCGRFPAPASCWRTSRGAACLRDCHQRTSGERASGPGPARAGGRRARDHARPRHARQARPRSVHRRRRATARRRRGLRRGGRQCVGSARRAPRPGARCRAAVRRISSGTSTRWACGPGDAEARSGGWNFTRCPSFRIPGTYEMGTISSASGWRRSCVPVIALGRTM